MASRCLLYFNIFLILLIIVIVTDIIIADSIYFVNRFFGKIYFYRKKSMDVKG